MNEIAKFAAHGIVFKQLAFFGAKNLKKPEKIAPPPKKKTGQKTEKKRSLFSAKTGG